MEITDKRIQKNEQTGRLYVPYLNKKTGKWVKCGGYIEKCSQCDKTYFTSLSLKKTRKRSFVLCESCARTGKNNGNWTGGKYRGRANYKLKEKKDGTRQGYHRWVWEQKNGEIPAGCIIHHKNGDRFDNRIENLECMTHAQHNSLHAPDRKTWNKGLTTKTSPKWKRAIERARKTRRENTLRRYKEIYELKGSTGKTYKELSEIFGICDRQIFEACKQYKKHIGGKRGRKGVE